MADFIISKYLFSDCHQMNVWSGVDGSVGWELRDEDIITKMYYILAMEKSNIMAKYQESAPMFLWRNAKQEMSLFPWLADTICLNVFGKRTASEGKCWDN